MGAITLCGCACRGLLVNEMEKKKKGCLQVWLHCGGVVNATAGGQCRLLLSSMLVRVVGWRWQGHAHAWNAVWEMKPVHCHNQISLLQACCSPGSLQPAFASLCHCSYLVLTRSLQLVIVAESPSNTGTNLCKQCNMVICYSDNHLVHKVTVTQHVVFAQVSIWIPFLTLD